jgi:trehalose synthase
LVIGGDAAFFRVTKRLHNRLHGFAGDGGPLDDDARADYERATERTAAELAALVRPGDVALLHDPQTAGLVGPLREAGAAVVWRCHVGTDQPNDLTRETWRFLLPYIQRAHAYVFSREAFVWDDVPAETVAIVPPSIDAFAPKNAWLAPDVVAATLHTAGIAAENPAAMPIFTRTDGTPGRVDRQAEAIQSRPLEPEDPVLAQVSRWDRLKDPLGVMRGFAEHVGGDARLVLAGPSTAAVSDDPEGPEVLREAIAMREGLPADVRERVHLLSLPMDDLEENATIVNALQRRADVIAQKSLAEGFGLTVAEGMWKGRPVIGSRVGGIQDQIVNGETGVLVDANDLEAFGRAAAELLADPGRAAAMGRTAQERVRDHFLGARHLAQYLELFQRVLGE